MIEWDNVSPTVVVRTGGPGGRDRGTDTCRKLHTSRQVHSRNKCTKCALRDSTSIGSFASVLQLPHFNCQDSQRQVMDSL